jgi:hypothetical protein
MCVAVFALAGVGSAEPPSAVSTASRNVTFHMPPDIKARLV